MKILVLRVINSSRHRNCFVRGYIHSLFLSKALTHSYLVPKVLTRTSLVPRFHINSSWIQPRTPHFLWCKLYMYHLWVKHVHTIVLLFSSTSSLSVVLVLCSSTSVTVTIEWKKVRSRWNYFVGPVQKVFIVGGWFRVHPQLSVDHYFVSVNLRRVAIIGYNNWTFAVTGSNVPLHAERTSNDGITFPMILQCQIHFNQQQLVTKLVIHKKKQMKTRSFV